MKSIDLSKRLQPLVDRFATALKTVAAERVDAVIGDVERSVDNAIAAIGKAAAPKPAAKPKRPRVPQTERAAAKPEPSKPTAQPTSASLTTTSRGTPRTRAPRSCRKCGAVGFRSDGCGKTHNVGGVTAGAADDSDDSEDEPRAPRRRDPSRQEEEHVISHDDLVRMLAADRERAGDAGGLVVRADRQPSLIGRTEEKRELCPVHGWVGRVAFERDQHELCALRDDAEPCRSCEGAGMSYGGAVDCKRCSGTGIEPEQLEAPEIDNTKPIAAAGYEAVVEPVVEGDRVRRRQRKRSAPRSKTVAPKKFTREALRLGWLDLGMTPEQAEKLQGERPKTRGECIDGPRPCPWVSCAHHLYLDVNPETGSVKLNFPDVEPWELVESCALDVADRGGLTLEDTGRLANLTRERVRQVELIATAELKVKLEADGIDASALDDFPHPEAVGNPDATSTSAAREESAKRARAAYKERQRATAAAKKENDAA